jgi:hypothetical protein
MIVEVEAERDAIIKEAAPQHYANADKIKVLAGLSSIGPEFATRLVGEVFYRSFDNHRQLASFAGIAPSPWFSGPIARDQGISKAGSCLVRTTMIELASTWLDYRLVERERMPLAMGGFGQEVRDAIAARAEHLVSKGLARRDGARTVPQPGLVATLRRRELDATGARLSAETGMPYAPPADGEKIAGTDRQRLTLTSGCFAMPRRNPRRDLCRLTSKSVGGLSRLECGSLLQRTARMS